MAALFEQHKMVYSTYKTIFKLFVAIVLHHNNQTVRKSPAHDYDTCSDAIINPWTMCMRKNSCNLKTKMSNAPIPLVINKRFHS